MPKWSEAQTQAIEHVGKNVVVSASAGSGKTAVLTARMVKRITQDRIPVEQLLAMTFTDAAASEMKGRLHAGLADVIATTTDEELRAYCSDQIALLGSAMICTIHSFCLQIIKENYYVIQLPVEQINNIFSEEDMLAIHEQVMKQTLQSMRHQDEHIFQRVSEHFSGRADSFEELKNTISKMVNTALSLGNPQAFFQTILNKAAPLPRGQVMDEELAYYFFLQIQLSCLNLKSLLEQMLEVAARDELDDEVIEQVQLKLNKLQVIFPAIQSHNYKEVVRILRNSASSKIKTAKSDDYKDLRKQVNDTFQSLVSEYFDFDDVLNDQSDLYPIVQFLSEATQLYLKLLESKKKDRCGIDFSDMEHLAHRILSANNKEVAKRYQERFAEILVDEFQDTNDFQNEMIEMVSRGNNIFRVGDIKQSIYRFRGAKPQIMADLMKKQDENNDSIVLKHNYRSNRSIVEFNNVLFERLMNVPGLNNEFSENDVAAIGTPGQNDDYQLPVQFLRIQPPEIKGEDKIKETNPKAHVLAHKILEMVQNSEFTKWSDYCVLVRSHAIKDEIRFVFESLNIPYTTTLTTGLYKSYSVSCLCAFLQLVENPSLNIECVSVLTTFYQLSDVQLAHLQTTRGKKTYHQIAYEQYPQYQEDIQRLRLLAKSEGVLRVLREILQINDFYWCMLNNQERANVDLFMEKAISFSKQTTGLSAFLKQVELCYDRPSSTAVSASKSDNVVQITTIHQSKGLQYPVVFFWSGSRTQIMDELTPCMVDEQLGLGLHHISLPYRYKRPTLARKAISTKTALEEFAENVRLYYVALTRAQKQAFILDTSDIDYIPQGLNLSTFFKRKGSTDAILTAMFRVPFAGYQECFTPHDFTSTYVASELSEHEYIMPKYRHKIQSETLASSTPSQLKQNQLQPLTYRQNIGAKVGTMLHKMVEELPPLPWTSELITNFFPQASELDIDKCLKLSKQVIFQQAHLGTIHKEYSYMIQLDHQIQHGFMDFISVDDTQVILIDFKSDRVDHSYELVERYRDQMYAYKKVLEHIYPQHQINCYIYSFRHDDMIQL